MESKIKYKVNTKELNYILSIKSRDLSSGAKLVLLNLINRLGRKRYCWPSEERIAKDLGLTSRQVRNHLSRLKSCSFIDWEKGGPINRKGRKPASNIYDLIHILVPYDVPLEQEEYV